MNPSAFAAAAAATISVRVALGLPYAMFSATVIGKTKASWRTTATCSRSARTRSRRMSRPSTAMLPDQGSKKRMRRLTRVVLPAPV